MLPARIDSCESLALCFHMDCVNLSCFSLVSSCRVSCLHQISAMRPIPHNDLSSLYVAPRQPLKSTWSIILRETNPVKVNLVAGQLNHSVTHQFSLVLYPMQVRLCLHTHVNACDMSGYSDSLSCVGKVKSCETCHGVWVT